MKDEINEKLIKDLKFPAPAIIGVVQRRNHVIIPKGDTQIQTGDILIIFTMAESVPIIKEYLSCA